MELAKFTPVDALSQIPHSLKYLFPGLLCFVVLEFLQT